MLSGKQIVFPNFLSFTSGVTNKNYDAHNDTYLPAPICPMGSRLNSQAVGIPTCGQTALTPRLSEWTQESNLV